MPQATADPVADLLMKAPPPLRADAWDAFHTAKNADEFATAIKAMPIADSVKADLWDLKQKQSSTPDFKQSDTTPNDLDPNTVGTFMSHLGAQINPITAIRTAGNAILHPIDTATAIGSAQGALFDKAKAAYDQKDYGTAARHFVDYLLPLVGPVLDKAADASQSGHLAAGAGDAIGLGLSMFGPKALAEMAPALAQSRPVQAIADAADTAANKRVVDVIAPKVGRQKVRFGNMAADIAPQVARQTTGLTRGSVAESVAANLEDATTALDDVADARLNARTFPTQPVLDALNARKQRLTAEAVNGSRVVPTYEGPSPSVAGDLSGASARRAISGGGASGAAGGRAFPSAKGPDVFPAVAAEARRLGYDGTNGTLRAQFDDAVIQAEGLQSELQELHDAHGPQALLRAVAKAGGIGSDAQYPGEVAQLWENSNGIVQGAGSLKSGARLKASRTLSSGGIAGVPGVLKKSGGLSLDSMAEILRQDPRFESIAGPNELIHALDEARISKAHAPTLDEALQVVGVRPGVKWWEGASAEEPAASPSEPPRTARPLGHDVIPAPNSVRVGQIDQALNEVKSLGPLARYESLRRLREAYDIPAKATYSPAVTADYLTAQGSKLGAADVTGALRDYLAKIDPQTAAANADYSLWKKASDVLTAAEETDRVRPTVGRTLMARGLGAAAGAGGGGAIGAAIGAVVGPLIERLATGVSPAIKLVVARQLAGLADALRAGDVGKAKAIISSVQKLAPAAVAAPATAALPMALPAAAQGPATSTPRQ